LRAFRFQIILLLVSLLLLGTAVWAMGSKEKRESKKHSAATTLKQGVHGRVEIWEGNFMPSTDPKSSTHKILPGAGRRVRVHQPLIISGSLHSARLDSVSTLMVAETVCDSTGNFSMSLAPGNYSIFV
jgi:hypothetical protein